MPDILTPEQIELKWRALWGLVPSQYAERFDEIKSALTADRNAWRSGLQSLTPMGSEFTTVEECVQFVRDQREKFVQWKKDQKAALRAKEQECERLKTALTEITETTISQASARIADAALAGKEAVDDR